MRLWSIHPKYLDAKGLVALWRECLLAKNVLQGNTKGYKNHPQLWRFKNYKMPVRIINVYLMEIYREAERREYNFDRRKINWRARHCEVTVTASQLAYETRHLLRKLKVRDNERYRQLKKFTVIEPHPCFIVVEGDIEHWEIR